MIDQDNMTEQMLPEEEISSDMPKPEESMPPEQPEHTADTEAEDEPYTEDDTQSNDTLSELSRLRKEVEDLQAALSQKEIERQNSLNDLAEFHRLFPDISLSALPDGIWESVHQGVPLTAAYALYEKKQYAAKQDAEQINRRNASLSAGVAGKNTSGEYFSPDEVRVMTQKQVHDNYRTIMESMKHWH